MNASCDFHNFNILFRATYDSTFHFTVIALKMKRPLVLYIIFIPV